MNLNETALERLKTSREKKRFPTFFSKDLEFLEARGACSGAVSGPRVPLCRGMLLFGSSCHSPKALREQFQPRERRRPRRRESAVETASLGPTARADGPNAELRVSG